MEGLTSKEIKGLTQAAEESRAGLRAFRQQRADTIREFVGKHYGDHGTKDKVPVNLLNQAMVIYLRKLVAGVPGFSITSEYEALKAEALDLQLAHAQLLRLIDFERTLYDVTQDALFLLGILKIGLNGTEPWEIDVDGEMHEYGQPFCDVVDFDDWVHDIDARRWELVQFEGNRYRLPLEYVQESGRYERAEKLHASEDQKPTKRDDDDVFGLSRGGGQRARFVKEVNLWDYFLPMHGLMVTVAEETGEQIAAIEWDGPPWGPYHKLAFQRVTGQMMPVSITAQLQDLHDLANEIVKKVGRQGLRQKTLSVYNKRNEGDAAAVRDAKDGDMVGLQSADGVKEVRMGGPDSVNLAFGIHLDGLFNRMAGNLELLGGLGPSSETARQDLMLNESGNELIQHFKKQVRGFAVKAGRDLAWYLWEDPLIELPFTKPIPGWAGHGLQKTWRHEDRRGEFLAYNFDIDPISLVQRTPEQRAALMKRMLVELIAPFWPSMEAQGIQLNWSRILQVLARNEGMKELSEMITIGGRPAELRAGPVETRKPAMTTRRTERVNYAGTVRGGRDKELMTKLMESGKNGR